MLQSTERLGNKERSWEDAQISLGKGNTRDFLSRLGEGRDGNIRDRIGAWEEGREIKKMS